MCFPLFLFLFTSFLTLFPSLKIQLKKKKDFNIAPLITILLYTTYQNLTSTCKIKLKTYLLFTSLIDLLSLYENKLLMPSSNMCLLTLKQDNEVLQTSQVPILCNLLRIFFILCLITPPPNKTSINYLYLMPLTLLLLTRFAFLTPLPSTLTKQ